ncbi:serine/threonine-protein kinase [Streptomyces sp. NBC_01264]|uniref:serine/threonine-protein kinase n=1 Tax=Streptomyces sp. NBC_01264 TaxID=2903804 RepID=UPI002251BA00|nr:serine/threonine-protein kinase [Streptomyces sp. NBC_01264]MCX4779951.1 serine/threonine protein kinase [Streptomyces sp. NBC_01264]
MEQLHSRDAEHIGPYRLLARLGTGGMGQVYLGRAEDHAPGTGTSTGARTGTGTGAPTGQATRTRTAAVKLIHPHLAAHPDFRTRFRREADAARLVGGDWTVAVLDADPDAEIPWLATAYIAGPSLRQAVGRDFGPLPAGSVRALGEGLSYALRDIHRAGLVHRDLKPGNILLTADGPRVIDFGIARALGATADPALTQTGELLGSPGFLAPEQITGTPVTAACDVFGLGAVLAYAATGRLPFGDPEQPGGIAALLMRVTEAEPELAGVPAELRDLVRDCLRKDPAARPAPAELLERLAPDRSTAKDPSGAWLPAPLVARLGQHAIALLDRVDSGPYRAEPVTLPAQRTGAEPGPASHVPVPAPVPVPIPVPVPTLSPVPGTGSGYAYGQGYGQGFGQGSGPFPGSEPTARARSRVAPAASTALLVAVAVVVAVAAGATVYTVMNGSGDGSTGIASGTSPSGSSGPRGTADASTPGTDAGTGPGTGSGTTPSPSVTPATLPEAYAGSWRAVNGAQSWQLTLSPGTTGSTVMSLTLQAPGLSCAWTAPLRSATTADVGLDPSTVISGTPPSCSPGGRSTLRLLPDGNLVRELDGSTAAPLTYRRR